MTQQSIMLEDDLTMQVEEICVEFGFTVSEAIRALIKSALENDGYPFLYAITKDPFYSPLNMAVLKKSIKEAEDGKLTEHELIEVEDDD
jgi:DNA-damage-inducible protein J